MQVRWQLPDGWLLAAAAALTRRTAPSPAAADAKLASWLQPQLVLLDTGMATELSSSDRHNMLHLFKAFVELDGATMARHALAFAGPEQGCRDDAGFKAAISQCAAFAKILLTSCAQLCAGCLPRRCTATLV